MTQRKYETVDDVQELVTSFEEATISRDDWRHAEHMVVALYYIDGRDEAYALERMRSGILNLLSAGFQVDLSNEMPYHETLTVFWVRTVADFNLSRQSMPIGERAAELVATYDKDYPLKFYSRELLFSDTARVSYVEPDLTVTDRAATL